MAQTEISTNKTAKSLTINQRRWRKFKAMKRGYYSFVVLMVAYALSFCLPLMVSNVALAVHYNGSWYFPVVKSFYSGETFGQKGNKGECNYRELKVQYSRENSGNSVIMPLYPFGPIEDISVIGNEVLLAPFDSKNGSIPRLFGTDDRGRDVFARMSYGFQVSLSFALILSLIEYMIGVPIGALLGYLGGKFDLFGQRLIEIWATLPFLFLIIIVVSFVQPSFMLLVGLLSILAWISITVLLRAEFYREKAKDYVAAAISIGVPTHKILLKHILPNSLVPIITYFPFAVIGGISALVSLDFLGFGLAPPTPSWGQMIGIGLQNLTKSWLVIVPFSAMFLTLMLVVFIGEGIREAFDPKTFSRLR